MPKSARPRAAPPPQGGQQPLTDRLGLPSKSAGPYPRNTQAGKSGRNPNQANAAASSSESVAGLLSRMNSAPNSAPSQPVASTSQSKASPAPGRAPPTLLADRIDGVAITASATTKNSDATIHGQTDTRWSGKGWQAATPVGGKPGSSAAAKKTAANGRATPANGKSQGAQAPASATSRPAPRLTDRISSPAVRPSSPAATAPSRSRSSTPARQSSNSTRSSMASARASPATGAQPSLLSRLGHQANSPRHGPHVDRSRRSSTSSDMSLSSSDRIAASSPPVPLTARLQSGVSVNGRGDDSRGSPTLSTTTAAPRVQNDPSSFSMSVLGSAPPGSNNSSQASRPAYMEKPAFDPSNRPGPQSIRGTGSAQADRVAPSSSQAPRPSGASAPVAQPDPATRFAPVTIPRAQSPPATSIAQTANRLNRPDPSDRDARAVAPPIAPRAMLENASAPRRSDDSTAALPPSSSHGHAPTAATSAPATDGADSTGASRSGAAEQRPQPAQGGRSGAAESEPEAGTPPLDHAPTSAPVTTSQQPAAQPDNERVRRDAEPGTPPPRNDSSATASNASQTVGSVPTEDVASSQANPSAQRIKREAKTPELDGARANDAGHPSATRSAAAQEADDAAAWAETAARYEAAKREIALLRRQEAVLEALRRERAASAKAREEAPPGDQAEQQARRVALLRDKMERGKAEGEAVERVLKAELNEDGHRTANAVHAELAARGGGGPVASSSAHSEESAANGAAPEAVSPGVATASGIVVSDKSNATATLDASPSTAGESAATLNKDTRRKRTASPPATAPSAKHARVEALGVGFANDESSSDSEATSSRTHLLPPPIHTDIKLLLPDDDAVAAAGHARSLAGRTGRFARRTPSGSPFSTRDAAAAFEPSLSAFLASFDVSLVPLAGPLIAAGFASLVDLARFASFEPDTRIAVLDALRTPNGDRVMLDLDAVDRLEDACAAAKAAKWLNCS